MGELRGLVVDWGGVLDDPMLTLLRAARARAIRTALLTNSGDAVPERLWVGAFDAVVTSAQVGLRKPDPEIYRHTARTIGLTPQECVFVDDLRANVDGAVQAGLVGVVHRSFDETREELEILFEQSLD